MYVSTMPTTRGAAPHPDPTFPVSEIKAYSPLCTLTFSLVPRTLRPQTGCPLPSSPLPTDLLSHEPNLPHDSVFSPVLVRHPSLVSVPPRSTCPVTPFRDSPDLTRCRPRTQPPRTSLVNPTIHLFTPVPRILLFLSLWVSNPTLHRGRSRSDVSMAHVN